MEKKYAGDLEKKKKDHEDFLANEKLKHEEKKDRDKQWRKELEQAMQDEENEYKEQLEQIWR